MDGLALRPASALDASMRPSRSQMRSRPRSSRPAKMPWYVTFQPAWSSARAAATATSAPPPTATAGATPTTSASRASATGRGPATPSASPPPSSKTRFSPSSSTSSPTGASPSSRANCGLEARREELTVNAEDEPEPLTDEEVRALQAHVREVIETGDPSARKALLQALVEEIRVVSGAEIYPSFACPRFDHRQGQRARQDSNLRPRAPEARALSPELRALVEPSVVRGC
jgi:hypothetical protein